MSYAGSNLSLEITSVMFQFLVNFPLNPLSSPKALLCLLTSFSLYKCPASLYIPLPISAFVQITFMYTSPFSSLDATNKLQDNLGSIISWADSNNLKLNPHKTHTIVFGPRLLINSILPIPPLILNSVPYPLSIPQSIMMAFGQTFFSKNDPSLSPPSHMFSSLR